LRQPPIWENRETMQSHGKIIPFWKKRFSRSDALVERLLIV
jgi:hypothetical protein